MAEIYIPAKSGPVVAVGERSWYAGPSSPVGRVLHRTGQPMRESAEVRVSCQGDRVQVNPHVDRDGMRRCASCCQVAGVRPGYGVPPAPKRRPSTEILSDELTTFTAAWLLEESDSGYAPWQLGAALDTQLRAAAKAAAMRLVGKPRWERTDGGSAHGLLRATVDARRILVPAITADGRAAA